MSDAARMAAVMLRVGAAAVIAFIVVVTALQVGVVLTGFKGGSGTVTLVPQLLLSAALFSMPAVWVYRNSRQLGIRLSRGLD